MPGRFLEELQSSAIVLRNLATFKINIRQVQFCLRIAGIGFLLQVLNSTISRAVQMEIHFDRNQCRNRLTVFQGRVKPPTAH